MTWIRKRIIAGLTALLMLIVLLPTWALADDDRKIDDGDVWTAIGELEQAGIEEAAHLMEDGTDPAKNPEYYASLSEQVEALVTARADYEPGSVIRRGAFFFWKDTSGVVYGYSPDLRAQLNGGREQEDTEALEDASALDAKIAALEEAQAARTKSASEEVVLMGGTTTDPDVAVFSPYYPNYDERFTKSVYYRGLQIAQATGGKCTFYYGTDVTIDKIAKALTENGVIFFDTHGSTDNTLFELVAAPGNTAYLTLTNRTGIDWEKDGAKVTAPNGDEYYHVFIFGWEKCCIDGAVIVNHVKGEVVTGLFGLNCCMGMKNDGLCRPLREAGVEVVYGYSQPVTFTTNNLHLRFLAEALTRGMDGAGIARYMKEQTCQYVLENLNLNDYTRENLTSLGSICWDPYHYNLSEERARENMDAFLLFCSPEDPYPAEGHRDQPQTVRSTWRLSLAGGGTDSGNIHISCETGQEIEQFFPNAVKTELIGGSLPGTLEIKTKTYGGEDIPALCGNVGDVPGYYEAFFNVTFKGGAKGNRRAEILVIDRTNDQTTEETLLAEAGTEQTLTFDYWDTADNFGYRKIDGEIPPGMEIVYDKETGLSFQGKPIIPGWYASLWRIVLKNGKEIYHNVRVHVPGKELETSESFLASTYNEYHYDLAAQDPSAVVQMDLLSGALPPGMSWRCSISEPPCILGRPSEVGSYSARFRFLCSDGTVQYHTVNVSTFVPGRPLSSYTVYVGGGQALVPKKDFDNVILHTLMGAVNAHQIKWNISKDGSEMYLDLDNDGNFDVIATLPEGSFVLFRKVSGCSITANAFTLTLNPTAITQAQSFGNYAEKLVFRLADSFDLYVDGTRVTTGNMRDILGDGVFSFDGGVTLSVHGDYYSIASNSPVISNGMPNLVVQVDTDSILGSRTDCIRTCAPMTIRGTGKLTLKTQENGIVSEGTLIELLNLDLKITADKKGIVSDGSGTPHARIIRSNVDIDSGTGAMYGFWSIGLDHAAITDPVYGQVKEPLPVESDSNLCLVDENRNLLTHATITAWHTKYDLSVNGIQVTDQNQTDILGDGKFSYDEESNVLNISGSLESNETIVASDIDELRILAAPGTVLKTSKFICLDLGGDTTLSGGPLTVISTGKFSGRGILVDSDSTLTVSNMDLTVEGSKYAISAQTGENNRLALWASNVTASGKSGAICGFAAGGVELYDCELILPAGGKFSSGAVTDGETAAALVEIGCDHASVSGTILTYQLNLPGSGTAKLIAAWYDAEGKLLGTAMTEAPRGAQVKGTIEVNNGADHYRLFALDKNSAPIKGALKCSE